MPSGTKLEKTESYSEIENALKNDVRKSYATFIGKALHGSIIITHPEMPVTSLNSVNTKTTGATESSTGNGR
jgi:hypothetical protein